MPSAPTIRLELRRSRLQSSLIAAVLLVAAAVPLFAPWPAWLRALALGGAVLAARALLGRRAMANRVTVLEWRGECDWRLRHGDGAGRADDDPLEPAQLLAARAMGPMIALDLRVGGRRSRLLLWPDSADADSLRRLRIGLQRLAGGESAPPGDGRRG